MSTMRALVLLEPGRMELQDVEIPTIEPDEILVKVGACGTCATDIKIYRGEQRWASIECLLYHDDYVHVASPDCTDPEAIAAHDLQVFREAMAASAEPKR